jgi:hypothetical protein
MLKYRHPQLGHFEQLTSAKGSGSDGGVIVSELELKALTHYLNAAKTPEQKKIVGILEQMRQLGEIEPPVWGERFDGPAMVEKDGLTLPNPAFEKVAPEKYRLQVEIERRKAALNRELARYRFTPYAYTTGPNRWTVIWWRERERPEWPGEMTEGQALELILNLARYRHLNRLRHCSHCRSWLYAKFRHQNFCSMKCQQKQYTQSDEWKEHRRKYMRNYYRDHFQVEPTRRGKVKPRR